MQQHEARVILEKEELDIKLGKLHAFCFCDNNRIFRALLPKDRDLLEDQYTAMKQYSDILGKRIAAFTVGKP